MLGAIGRLFRRRGREEDGHAQVRNLSSEYLDGELDGEAAKMVEAHLEMCPPCSAFFRTLKATIGLLGSSERTLAPSNFRERLRQRLRKERA